MCRLVFFFCVCAIIQLLLDYDPYLGGLFLRNMFIYVRHGNKERRLIMFGAERQ